MTFFAPWANELHAQLQNILKQKKEKNHDKILVGPIMVFVTLRFNECPTHL
jgi:hypothetical protein